MEIHHENARKLRAFACNQKGMNSSIIKREKIKNALKKVKSRKRHNLSSLIPTALQMKLKENYAQKSRESRRTLYNTCFTPGSRMFENLSGKSPETPKCRIFDFKTKKSHKKIIEFSIRRKKKKSQFLAKNKKGMTKISRIS